jgi:L-alanine-DL-glutamate epimerase-like enolase superfamily enzyme
MRLEHDRYTLQPRTPFSIARGTTTAYERVRVRLADDSGLEGWGEAAPNAFYRESGESVIAALPRLAAVLSKARAIDSLEAIDELERAMCTVAGGDASARSAVSAAAHDLLGKHRGQPLWRLFGLDPMTSPPTSYTIVIPRDEGQLFQRIDEARPYPILKVKLGSDRDEWIVRTVRRAAPRKVLRADANAAWDVARAARMAALLADEGFELLEQPLPPADIEGFRALKPRTPIPVIADESCRTSRDIAPLDGAVHGINIKLSKCGGLAEARRMIAEARDRGMLVMLGCMIESSLGITAASHLAPLVNYADLDGAALLDRDPFIGTTIDDGFIRLPSEPGLGVRIR